MTFLLRRKQDLCYTSLLIAVVAVAIALVLSAQAQTFTVIHSFTGADGANPVAGLTIDGRGRLYGTTELGGHDNGSCYLGQCGTVFRLAPQGDGWVLTSLDQFNGPSDAGTPLSTPSFGPNGVLYGTTVAGGSQSCFGTGCGTVYSVQSGPTVCTTARCPWLEHLVYAFAQANGPACGGYSNWSAGLNPRGARPERDLPTQSIVGDCPSFGGLTFDHAGDIYGIVGEVVYELTPEGQGSTLYTFTGGSDGGDPLSGVTFDQAGNLYGTAGGGGAYGCGVIYELSPNGSGWTEKVLYSFECDGLVGDGPLGGLTFDAAGSLYGTTNIAGANQGGAIFKLSPSGGTWTLQLVYSLTYRGIMDYSYYGPTGSLAIDSAGNLYGTAVLDGANAVGSVFKLSPSAGGWIYTDLHDFTDGSDGGNPFGNVVLDASGNLYGTAAVGGESPNGCGGFGCGVVWEITP